MTVDAYVVNGLQGSPVGIDFLESRDYLDNNSEPGVGGRITIGNQYLSLGSSMMAGRFNDDGVTGPLGDVLNYEIFGVDITARYQDLVRIEAEYAQRNSDRFLFVPTLLREACRYWAGILFRSSKAISR